MGYLSNYTIEMSGDADKLVPTCDHEKPGQAQFCPTCGRPNEKVTLGTRVWEYITEHRGRFGGLVSDGPTKWYEWQESMLDLSRVFPTILFTVERQGEDCDDVERGYFKNGRRYVAAPAVVWPEFDEEKLK